MFYFLEIKLLNITHHSVLFKYLTFRLILATLTSFSISISLVLSLLKSLGIFKLNKTLEGMA